MTLEAVRRNPDIAIRSLEQTLGLSREIARQTYETLAIPTLESQVGPTGQWSLTSEKGGLAEKLLVAAEALHEVKIFEKPVSAERIRASIDPRYVQQYLRSSECL